MTIQEYQSKRRVMAVQLDNAERINTANGPRSANDGDYVVYTGNGVVIMTEPEFEAEYELIPESVSEARRYTPDGKTVPEVLEFFRDNPSEIHRVKELEAKSGNRKGILEYEIG